jgi:hypothetical protein
MRWIDILFTIIELVDDGYFLPHIPLLHLSWFFIGYWNSGLDIYPGPYFYQVIVWLLLLLFPFPLSVFVFPVF